jgi:hypothetical protein
MKLIYSSDDGGSSWQRAAVVGPMNWPQASRRRRWPSVAGFWLLGTRHGMPWPPAGCQRCRSLPRAALSGSGAAHLWAPASQPAPTMQSSLSHMPPAPAILPPLPQIFRCASGTYLLGVERHFSPDNNLVISKMLDDKGGSVGG